MTQNSTSPSLSRPLSHPDGDDLDALLDSIMGDDPGPRPERGGANALREAPRQRLEPQRVEDQRARQVERTTDELRSQIRSLALQVHALSTATADQAAQGKAIQELRMAMRQVLVATHQPPTPPPTFNAELQLPSLQIKLVLAQAANLLHQADKDMMVLGNCATLFAGTAIGTFLSLAGSIAGPYTTRFWIYLAVAFFALLVAGIFAFLAYQARCRVVRARKAMDESTLTRTVPVNG